MTVASSHPRRALPRLRLLLPAWVALSLASCSFMPCSLGETECDGACVSTFNDARNCGRCGLACGPAGSADTTCDFGRCRCRGSLVYCALEETCVEPSRYTIARCVGACAPPTTDCATACADLSSDPNHCGRCGRSCGRYGACEGGACACRLNYERCGADCVDVESDPQNCGRCGRACAAPTTWCHNGACVCPQGPSGNVQTPCGGACVDTSRDPANCGVCGHACDADQVCSDRACDLTCAPGLIACGRSCRDTRYDRRHCGRCDNACDGACYESQCR